MYGIMSTVTGYLFIQNVLAVRSVPEKRPKEIYGNCEKEIRNDKFDKTKNSNSNSIFPT